MGSVPWQGMVFFTLWLQLKGLPDAAAAAVYAMFLTGTAFGGALGGFLGDRASLLSPNHGRIIISQVSVALGLPLSFLIIKVHETKYNINVQRNQAIAGPCRRKVSASCATASVSVLGATRE